MKICILGCAKSWVAAPFGDSSVQIWTLNGALINQVPRFDRHFEVHTPYWFDHKNNPVYFAWLQKNQGKVWMMDKTDDFPEVNIINWKALTKKHGEYFTSSIAWMMAVALEEKNVSDIYLCGVDLAQKQEYEEQRPCVEYFIGKAKERGIEVHIQTTSTLLKSKGLYGIMK